MKEEYDVVTKLKFGQQEVLHLVDDINLTIRNYKEAKPKLRALQDKLLAHFSLQPQDLYDQLSSQFSDKREKAKKIEFLIQDLKEIKIKVLLFYDEHPADTLDLHGANFPLHFTQFAREVQARLSAEREYLIPLLEEIHV